MRNIAWKLNPPQKFEKLKYAVEVKINLHVLFSLGLISIYL